MTDGNEIKKRTHLVVDVANTFFKARYVGPVREASTPEEKAGMALHIFLSSIRKCWNDFVNKDNNENNGHVILCLEGGTPECPLWRKKFYADYKANRVFDVEENPELKSIDAVEEAKAFQSAFRDLVEFFREKTNCTVLQAEGMEADDMVAGWIEVHKSVSASNPDYEFDYVIVSADQDFYQLLGPNVSIWNGIKNQHITIDGVYDNRGEAVIDKKTNEHMHVGDPEYLLFEKCIRGDKSDNIFSAYPKVRKKGSKSKPGIEECFADRFAKGEDWDMFMRQRWPDHHGNEVIVADAYERNKLLIDLRGQPKPVREKLYSAIAESVSGDEVKSNVGFNFIKFCGLWHLDMLAQKVTDFGHIFSAEKYNS